VTDQVQKFETGYRDPFRGWWRTGGVAVVIVCLVYILAGVPLTIGNVVGIASLVAIGLVAFSGLTTAQSGPDAVEVGPDGITLRISRFKTTMNWADIESIELRTYPLTSRIARRIASFSLEPGAQGEFVVVNLRRRKMWTLWRNPFVAGFPFSKSTAFPIVGAPRFVEFANARLQASRLTRD
jgi:hypothetical protein